MQINLHNLSDFHSKVVQNMPKRLQISSSTSWSPNKSFYIPIWGDDAAKINEIRHFLHLLFSDGNRYSWVYVTDAADFGLLSPDSKSGAGRLIFEGHSEMSLAKSRSARRRLLPVQGIPMCSQSMKQQQTKSMAMMNSIYGKHATLSYTSFYHEEICCPFFHPYTAMIQDGIP